VTIETAVAIPGVTVVNDSGMADNDLAPELKRLERQLSSWVGQVRAAAQASSMFDRGSFAISDDPYDRMRAARLAVDADYVVGAVADMTESLAYQGSKVESKNSDEADIFNQIWADLNGDELLRNWHREEFTYSQVIIGMWWGKKSYTVRGYHPPAELPLTANTDPMTGQVSYEEPRDPETNRPMKPKKGVKKKKKYDVVVPIAVTFLNPLKIVPVGTSIFGADQLAWHATREEIGTYQRVINGEITDPVMTKFFAARYVPNVLELSQLGMLRGVDPFRLILLDENNVFRHTRTKAQYERFPDVRLRTVFPLLDLKQQLLEADRVALVGAANYILLVRKGTKDDPGTQAEIDNLNQNMRVLAKLPVIVSDHRLEILIIVPPQEHVLDQTKYDAIDHRIYDAAIGSLSTRNATRADTTLTSARSVGRMLESQRLMIKRTIERRIFKAIVDHPANAGKFEEEPNLSFVPGRIQLDTEQQIVQALMTLRTQKEISRETILEYFGLDQEVEAQRREYEEDSGLDAIFQTSIPFNSPGNLPPGGQPPPSSQMNGAQGGRPPGGGTTPQSPAKQNKPKSAAGNPTTRAGS